jgi:hypothetical protein
MKNDFKLSFTDNTTFYGKDAEGFYANALLTGSSKSLFTLIPNVKSKIKLAQLNIGNILQAADCSFSNTGEGTLAQKSFEVEPIKINLSYCKRTFETNYLSQLLRPGSNNAEVMPPSVEAFLLNEVSNKVSADLEQLVWKGNIAGTTASYPLPLADGLEKQLLADGAVVDVASTTLSASNIIAQIALVYNAILPQILDEAVIMVGSAAYRFYRQALANASSEAYYMQDHAELRFLGVRVIEAKGMSANKMVAGRLDNFLLLTDLMSDFEAVQILPQSNVTGEPTVRMTAEFKFAVGYVYGSEIVFYN